MKFTDEVRLCRSASPKYGARMGSSMGQALPGVFTYIGKCIGTIEEWDAIISSRSSEFGTCKATEPHGSPAGGCRSDGVFCMDSPTCSERNRSGLDGKAVDDADRDGRRDDQ